jgi:hypothetical protein
MVKIQNELKEYKNSHDIVKTSLDTNFTAATSSLEKMTAERELLKTQLLSLQERNQYFEEQMEIEIGINQSTVTALLAAAATLNKSEAIEKIGSSNLVRFFLFYKLKIGHEIFSI